ncbi:MAG: DUF4826 family protein [Woeseiaceae bacterium]|jgi:hypothetical protein
MDREKNMAESAMKLDSEEVKAWYTKLLDNVVKEMISLKAVSGAAVQAAPVWIAPYEMLMAKVWGVGNEHDFIWTLSIDKLIADYIAGSLASSPREAAKHFSLKWQLDADRMSSIGQGHSMGDKADKALEDYSSKLIRYAETLYDLTTRDEVWEEQQSLAN